MIFWLTLTGIDGNSKVDIDYSMTALSTALLMSSPQEKVTSILVPETSHVMLEIVSDHAFSPQHEIGRNEHKASQCMNR